MRIDLFCRVIDNWGDAGVCWRLARQLVRERGAQVAQGRFGAHMRVELVNDGPMTVLVELD